MSIECPHCRQRLTIKKSRPGNHTPKCPKCGLRFSVTVFAHPDQLPLVSLTSNESSASPATKPSTSGADQPTPVQSPLPKGAANSEIRRVSIDALLIGWGADLYQPLPLIDSQNRKEPQQLVMGCGGSADRLYQQIEPELLMAIPAGSRLKPAECKSLLTTMLNVGTPEESLVEFLLGSIRSYPTRYLSGAAPSALEVAETVYEQLQKQLPKVFPHRVDFEQMEKARNCIASIEALVEQRIPTHELTDAFLKLVALDPEKYLTIQLKPDPLPPRELPLNSPFLKSSAPVTMQRSEARQAD